MKFQSTRKRNVRATVHEEEGVDRVMKVNHALTDSG